jgi:hypothetical protein
LRPRRGREELTLQVEHLGMLALERLELPFVLARRRPPLLETDVVDQPAPTSEHSSRRVYERSTG